MTPSQYFKFKSRINKRLLAKGEERLTSIKIEEHQNYSESPDGREQYLRSFCILIITPRYTFSDRGTDIKMIVNAILRSI